MLQGRRPSLNGTGIETVVSEADTISRNLVSVIPSMVSGAFRGSSHHIDATESGTRLGRMSLPCRTRSAEFFSPGSTKGELGRRNPTEYRRVQRLLRGRRGPRNPRRTHQTTTSSPETPSTTTPAPGSTWKRWRDAEQRLRRRSGPESLAELPDPDEREVVPRGRRRSAVSLNSVASTTYQQLEFFANSLCESLWDTDRGRRSSATGRYD